MSFKKEVRVFIADMRLLSKAVRDFIKMVNVERNVYEKTIERLEKENSELKDRLFARDLPEFKTYQLNSIETEKITYKPEEDEANIGESVEI